MLCSDDTTVCPGDMLSFESQSRQILGKICEELALNPGEKGLFRRVLDRSSARPFFAAHPNVAGKPGTRLRASDSRYSRPVQGFSVLVFPLSMHWSFSLFALTELSDMMTKTATMATAKYCQSERGLSNMIFAFGARRKVCGAKERNKSN